MTKQNKSVEEIVKFVMEKANGIDDYNWGQEQFEKDLKAHLTTLTEQVKEEERERIVEIAKELEKEQMDGAEYSYGYRKALSDIKALLTKEGE